MKRHRSDLAKLTVAQTAPAGVPLPSHFSTKMFTLGAFDNFDHSDKNTLSEKSSSHDMVTVLFQERPKEIPSKPRRSEINFKGLNSQKKLQCQELCPYSSNKTLDLARDFTVCTTPFESEEVIRSNNMNHFVISSMQGNGRRMESDEVIPSWAGTKAMLSKLNVPLMQVAFLPFMPFPVTEH